MKFLTLLLEQSDEVTKFQRRVLDNISKKFDLSETKPNQNTEWDEMVREIRRYLKYDLSLTSIEINTILMLLLLNINVKDFMKDVINIGEGYYVYDVWYLADEIEDFEHEEEEECEDCGGSGWQDEDCSFCDGEGEIDYGDSIDSCPDCEGAGTVDVDCNMCGGDTVLTLRTRRYRVDEFSDLYLSPTDVEYDVWGKYSPEEFLSKLENPILINRTSHGDRVEMRKEDLVDVAGKIESVSVIGANSVKLDNHLR